MRILVYEFASGGGFAGQPVPRTLAREGRAMLNALLADLSVIGGHDIVTTTDTRVRPIVPSHVEVVPIGPGQQALSRDRLSAVDGVWLIAPETGGCLERLAAAVERSGKLLLGTGARAIRTAADKARLPARLARCGVSHPPTRLIRAGDDLRAIAETLGYPLVVKPSRGAGCEGVRLARHAGDVHDALAHASRPAFASLERGTTRELMLQRYVPGVAASVSLICNGRSAIALSINTQTVRAGRLFSYHGGRTPLDHPLASRGIDAAIRACEALRNLRGYVGVDLVLTDSDAVVIEVNPRLTTAYLGVREAVRGKNGDGNVAAMAIAACRGALPRRPTAYRRVKYTASGRVIVSES